MKKPKIVILGGGFGGVRAALDLTRHICHDADILLIDQYGYHEYPPDYYQIATTFLPEKIPFSVELFEKLRETVSMPLSKVIRTDRIHLKISKVVDINTESRHIKLSSGEKVEYDWLVIAVGSISFFIGNEDIKSYALELKSANDALNIRNKIDEIFASKAKHETINIVIAGGGFTGCEFSGALSCYVKKLSRIHSHPKEKIRISIIEAGSSLLGGAHPYVQKVAKKHLESLGVNIFFESAIESVTSSEIALKNKKPFLYDVLVWTVGVRANPLSEKLRGVKRNQKSCLIVDEYLRVVPFENIFAIGDASYCADETGSKGLPMTAQIAISQGRYVAYTLKRIIHKKRLFRYHPIQSRFVVPIGRNYAIADLGWIRFSGYAGWIIRRLIDLNYYTTILPWRDAWKRWRYKL